MSTILQPIFILVLFVLIHSADISITAGTARCTIRAVAYGIVAILALIAVVIMLLGVHA